MGKFPITSYDYSNILRAVLVCLFATCPFISQSILIYFCCTCTRLLLEYCIKAIENNFHSDRFRDFSFIVAHMIIDVDIRAERLELPTLKLKMSYDLRLI